jgi:magnesium and cobalt transporter
MARSTPDIMEAPSKPGQNWFERLSNLLLREPEDREELVDLLHSAFERNLLDADALAMIEGVLSVSELTVGDVMIPRSQINVIRQADQITAILPMVIESGHSRFPVIGDDRDDVIGILLAKDLLRYFYNPETFSLSNTLRPVVFVPESKPLNVLLTEFRSTRNHLAIAVDEYGGVAGLVTIEDVIEQIVGDIEDEFDFIETEDQIVPVRGQRFRVNALTEIDDFNQYFDSRFSSDDADTIGGMVVELFGHVPKRGDSCDSDGMRFTVIKADSRRLQMLLVEKIRSES